MFFNFVFARDKTTTYWADGIVFGLRKTKQTQLTQKPLTHRGELLIICSI
jgi:hypothetical protein